MSARRLWMVLLRSGVGCSTLGASAGLGRGTVGNLARGYRRRGYGRTWRRIVEALAAEGVDLARHGFRGSTPDEAAAWLAEPISQAQAAWCRRRSEQLMETLGRDGAAGRERPAFRIITRRDLWSHPSKQGGRPERYPDVTRHTQTRRRETMIPHEVVQHFGLKFDPFTELQNRDDMYLSKSMRVAEALILQAAKRREMLALTGDVGSGKTTVARRALDALMASSRFAVAHVQTLHRERVNARTIQEALLAALEGGDASVPSSPERLTQRVMETVRGRLRANVNPVLVIDEAQALNAAALRPLKRLREVTGEGWKAGCAVILIGQTNAQPDLRAKLSLPTVKEVADRIQQYHLEPLNGELAEYIDWRMQRAGSRRKLVDAGAVRAIAHHYRGNVTPLTAQRVLARALVVAWQTGQKTVTGEIVAEVLGEMPDLFAGGDDEDGRQESAGE